MANVLEHQLVAAAQVIENQLDQQLDRLENLGSDDLKLIREHRIKEMKELNKKKQEWLQNINNSQSKKRSLRFRMVLTGHEICAHDNAYSQVNGTRIPADCVHNDLNRSRGHNMAYMMATCQNPLAKNCAKDIGSQSGLMSNQVSNVIKRVHKAAAVEFNDNAAKRCRYESAGHFDDCTVMTTYQNLEEYNGKHCNWDNNGDIEMDEDLNLNNLFSQQPYKNEQQSPQLQELQEQQSVQQQHPSESQSQMVPQLFQDQNNGYCAMGYGNFALNSYFHKKFYAINNTANIAAFPEAIDDIEYMYQATHGGDFMRHLNNYSGEDL